MTNANSPAVPTNRVDGALVWMRRDLRVHDHAALYHALRHARRVWCVFVFDRTILDPLPRADRRVEFIRDSLVGLDAELRALAASHGIEGAGLIVLHDDSRRAIPALARALRVQVVHLNHDDEPQSLARDASVRGALASIGVAMHSSKDHVVFQRDELMSQSGTPYGVFTPYARAWSAKIDDYYVAAYPIARHAAALAPAPEPGADIPAAGVPSLESLGFERTNLHSLKMPSGQAGGRELLDDFLDRIDSYDALRNFPARKGPSYLSTHLRFGTVSIRDLARQARARSREGSTGAKVWLNELIWRDFYHQVLHHHPHVVTKSFKPLYDAIVWERGKQADTMFKAWCDGATGYPLVDAAMHQINQTGYMHNRLRMVVASFLIKHLGIDWRRGEAYFATHLNDFDLAANNGGWQWAASSGCDAQPYFRIFNPVTQSQTYDADGKFIRRYLPQLAKLPDKLIHAPWKASPVDLEAAGVRLGRTYPMPLVDHDAARAKTLERYSVVKVERPSSTPSRMPMKKKPRA
jgi:deoxyribodipyrimidine photo-lyase